MGSRGPITVISDDLVPREPLHDKRKSSTVYLGSDAPLILMLNLVRYDYLLAVVVGFGGLTFLVMRAGNLKRRLPYPPGPKSLPIIGCLCSIPSQEEWVTYKKWSEELGVRSSRHLHLVRQAFNRPLSGSDIVHAEVMGSHIVILNSTKVANELLEKRSSIYSDR